jgi:hypothetical protein
LQGADFAQAVEELNRAIDRVEGLLLHLPSPDSDLVFVPELLACLNRLQTSGLSSLLDVNYFGRRKIAPWHDGAPIPLTKWTVAVGLAFRRCFLEGIPAMPVLDLGFTHSSYNNRPMPC